MTKIITIFLIVFITSEKLLGQMPDTLTCDVLDRDTVEAELLPWFGNNNYLDNFLDSIGYDNNQNRIIGSDKVWYHVPIKFWIYRNNNGVGGPNLQQIQNYIDNLNRLFTVENNTKIGFYMLCQITYIDNNSHLEVDDLEAIGLVSSHKENGAINIHITDDLKGAAGATYRSKFLGIEGIFLDRATYTSIDLRSTLAHEVGHYFELDHTHQYSNRGKCRKEAIDRNRDWPFFGSFCPFGGGGSHSQKICEATGDFLKDTPADHDLSSNNSCNYSIIGQTDPWGDHYESPPAGSLPPSTRNILSYNRQRGCRDVFSRLQIAVMLYSIERGKNKFYKSMWRDQKAEFDDYEMNNFSSIARLITVGELQGHNFHQQYNPKENDNSGNLDNFWEQCDVDWVRFIPACSQTLNITTSEIPFKPNANTRLTLFNSTLTELAQNDNISSNNLFSNINWNFIAGQEYFIRVENMQSLITSYYNLQIGSVVNIIGNEFPCINTPTTYSLAQAAPNGSIVTWSIVPDDGTVVLTPNGASVDINAYTTSLGAYYTLTATVSGACYFGIGSRQINIPAASWQGSISGYYGWSNIVYNANLVEGDNNLYLYGTSAYEIWNAGNNAYPGTSYWEYMGGDRASWGGYYSSYLGFDFSVLNGVDSYYNFTYTDECGTHTIPYHFIGVYAYPPQSRGTQSPTEKYKLTISPNPATNVAHMNVTETDSKIVSKLFDYNTVKTIYVYDRMGNIIMQRRQLVPKGGIRLDVSMLRSGEMYNIVVEDKNGLRLNGKLIKK
jgi:hypothetical protein